MRAVCFRTFGGPEVLSVEDVPEPHAAAGEIRIRVAAATVNPAETGLRGGRRGPERFKSLVPPYILGMELSGIVDEVGDGVSFGLGDRVMAFVPPLRPEGGAQAEYVVVPADSAVAVPDNLDLTMAATIPANGLAATLCLDLAELRKGDTVAVTGAAGMLGSYILQLAGEDGMTTIADARLEDVPLVHGFGADRVLERGDDLANRICSEFGRVDAIIDCAVMGVSMMSAVRDGGVFVAVKAYNFGADRGIRIKQLSVKQYARNQVALKKLAGLAAAGKLVPRIAGTVRPEEAADAYRKLEAGGVRGRYLIQFE